MCTALRLTRPVPSKLLFQGTLISELIIFLLIAVPLRHWDFAYTVYIRVLLTWFLNYFLNTIIIWGHIARSKETSHKPGLIGRKSPLVLYWKIDFFEVLKRCRAHLSTQCILLVLIVLIISFNLRCSYIVAKCRNTDTASSNAFASFLPGNEFGEIERSVFLASAH